jgi:hypothetical protein
MNQDKPRLLASLLRASDNEARHLLLYFLRGSAETTLVKFTHGVETPLGNGTEYEMNQKGNDEIQAWVTEGFKIQPEGKVFERLPWTIALAKKLGHTIVYDPRLQQTNKLPFNATGAVPLDQWAGVPGKNGGGYLYALGNTHIHAQPTPAPNYQPPVPPSGASSGVAFVQSVKALQEAFGQPHEFLLGDQLIG